MNIDALTQEYRGWTIRLAPADQACSSYSLTLAAPDGKEAHHVASAGLTIQSAMQRGKDMVDFEADLAEQRAARKGRS